MAHSHSQKEFKAYREKMNEKILERGNLQIKRFFNLDTQAYNDGALSRKTKELMGLVASLVLRCDDCVTYHIIQCVEQKVSDEEFFEAFNVGLIVGGSIVIPHLRSAVEMLEECRRKQERS
jgi:AhpD family alkylhydroperoxidase